jgi:superfamily I DNA/RNA helicase
MIFLSPLQRRAVDRAVHGPVRVSGGPGTGKTVVGLHRVVQFAEATTGPRRVLVTSFVQNVPEVLRGLYERLAPRALHDRTVFRTIHSIAGQVLAERGLTVRVDELAARARFLQALNADPNRRAALERAGFGEQYLWDEVSRIIEGRGITSLDEYLKITRHGRRQRMNESDRRLVWSTYATYRDACQRVDPPIASWSRHLLEARSALAQQPAAHVYDAIVVDEAQDITEVGIRLLIDLLHGGHDGQIVLIGDNAQRIYPGGFRLADVGLEVRGRSFSLTLCYRSTEQIMKAAGALGKYVSSEEFGEDALRERNWSPARTGTRPTLREFRALDEEQAWVTQELRANLELLDATAVLLPTNNLKDIWKGVLTEAGISVCDLLSYKGTPLPGVKVGTYNRAKGLEFKRVILPNLSDRGLRADPNHFDELITKGSQLFVAMTRARDTVDMSYAGSPCLYIDALLDHVDVR